MSFNRIGNLVMFLTLLWVQVAYAQKNQKPSPGIIPAPVNVTFNGKSKSNIQELKVYLPKNFQSTYISALFAAHEQIRFSPKASANVIIKQDKKLTSEEYHLYINKDKINILAGSKTGAQFGIISLLHIVMFQGYPLPILTIRDKPKFTYRGMHLDVARHFYGVDDIKKHIDYMAFYKYNHFHWHLTDDQGWRIEIKKYPKLQEIAAYRSETLIGHYNDQPHRFDGTKYGGYYTQDEIREIVSYAAERSITVIPEIEMPGHAQAALAAYPELGCEDKTYHVATKWGVFEDVFCPKEETFRFLEGVIDEVVSLFPGKYIHIGGDECPKDAWNKSSFCQELIQKNGLKDAHGIQSYFITRMEKYINSKGKQIIGWDEILEGGLAPNATVMSWRGIEGGLTAARESHDVIMTPGSHCYFDHYQSEAPDEPIAIGGYTPLEKVYHWDPVPAALAKEKRKYILGGQANLWSEYIKEYSGVQYMVYARGMAMAEALWGNNKNYVDFIHRFGMQNKWWKTNGAHIANHLYELKPRITAGNGKPVTIRFEASGSSVITHAIPGGESASHHAGQEIIIDRSGSHIFQAEDAENTGKRLALDFDLHLATSAVLTLKHAPSPQYSGNGPGSIINGVSGSDQKYGGSEWLGFSGKDCLGVLDFGREIFMDEISFRFFKGEGQWIYLPSKVTIMQSIDGVQYNEIAMVQNIDTPTKICTLKIPTGGIKIRFLKFEIANFGKIPDGAQGAGHGAWLFVDEIKVR